MSNPLALVTGASRGIGRRFCIDLAKNGWDVVCAARSTGANPGKLPGTVDATATEAEKAGVRALAVGLDVRDEGAAEQLAARIYDEFGRCDLLVNNAAVAAPRPALSDSIKRWDVGVDVNLNGPFYLSYHLAPRMAEAGGGRIVNISSGAAVFPGFGRPNYTVTKLALEGLTQCLGHELRSRNVAVNCIRLDLAVWSEGFAETLPKDSPVEFEDAVIMSDALLWLLDQPLDYTGQILSITALREKGVVRGVTPADRS